MEEKDNILTIDHTGLWLDIQKGELFDQSYIKDWIDINRDPWKVISHE